MPFNIRGGYVLGHLIITGLKSIIINFGDNTIISKNVCGWLRHAMLNFLGKSQAQEQAYYTLCMQPKSATSWLKSYMDGIQIC